MKARAKHDVKILMEDGRFSDFREGNEYRCMLRGGDTVILIDEQKTGFTCDMKSFEEDFEMMNQ